MAIATIFDVAKQAGVSIKTVSLVMNGHGNVREETRARVLAAAKALNYRPNYSARSLAGSKSFLIGMLYDNPIPSYVTAVQMGAVSYCRRNGYHLMAEPVDTADPEVGEDVDKMLSTLRPDGLILTPLVTDHTGVMDRIEAFGTPYVRIAPGSDRGRSAHVLMSDRDAARTMTAHLIALGHRTIGFVKGPEKHGAAHLRFEGFVAAMREAGLSADLLAQGDFTFASGLACGEALLTRADRPSAVFCANDEMALGVMLTAQRLGLSVPKDLSVAGFDDSPAASMVWPQLTTVKQPIFEMAEAAAEMLIAGLAAPDPETGAPPSRTLDFSLVLRDSTAPPA